MVKCSISGKILQLLIKMFPDPKDFKDFSEKLARNLLRLEAEKITLPMFKEKTTKSARIYKAEDTFINRLILDIEETYSKN